MSDIEAVPLLPRLPIEKTVRLAYSSYIRNFADLLRASWLWILVVGVTVAATYATPWREDALFLQLFATASVAVAWHRTLIIGESPGFSGSNAASRELWRYILLATLLSLLSFVPILIVGGLSRSLLLLLRSTGAGSFESIWMLLLRLAVVAVTIIVTCRLTLVLPARAIGQIKPTLREAWARTRHNTWPLFCGTLAASLPQLLVVQLFAPPFAASPPVVKTDMTTGGIANAVAYAVFYVLAIQVSVGFLSHAYRHFFAGADLESDSVQRQERP